MRAWLMVALGLLVGACCEGRPETYRGATLTGCSGGEVECCSYEGDGCSYVLCSDDCYESEASWACW